MAPGALIAAYQEDDLGGLRALLPLAGRTLVEYQARCVAAAGCTPIVLLVERIPAELAAAVERLRGEGIAVTPVTDGNEAASRFEAGALVLNVADGLAPDIRLVERIAAADSAVVAVVPDDELHERFERIDGETRWAGLSLVTGQTLGSTASMLGDWDLQSTLLRRTIQAGAARIPAGVSEPLLAERPGDLATFQRRLLLASRGVRRDWTSRFLLPIVEEFATEKLMERSVPPDWLLAGAVGLLGIAAVCLSRGWLLAAAVLLLLSLPLDLVAERLAVLRLKPLRRNLLTRRLLWPLIGIALLFAGWWASRHGSGWGAMATALTATGFAEAQRVERGLDDLPADGWLFSRRNAILLSLPLLVAQAPATLVSMLALYAAISFFFVQHLRHSIIRD
ncbi:hypothetical protein HMF7854_09055 [Sphingomonas ginkgonis]|uniref:Uncharacterized protein n=1 Tax=Sphingomonas ginkgonis TaxID=2315330 RepID=A0A429VAK0_9SPHN|nr:hypothetical protein [Sphingomonas ginkgonis]RST30964.1 hypothetical protein HMF7854_09055 [Sphingomonas ginkgonis]